MSRRLLIRLVLVAVLVFAGATSLRAAWANADSLSALDAAALVPSQTPDLLGPITENGRKGWDCVPERAAAAASAAAAGLPLGDSR